MPLLVATKKFEKELIKLLKKNSQLEKKIEKTLVFISENPKHPSLRLHELSGIHDHYSISINMSIRMIISIDQDTIYLLQVGTHDNVY